MMLRQTAEQFSKRESLKLSLYFAYSLANCRFCFCVFLAEYTVKYFRIKCRKFDWPVFTSKLIGP